MSGQGYYDHIQYGDWQAPFEQNYDALKSLSASVPANLQAVFQKIMAAGATIQSQIDSGVTIDASTPDNWLNTVRLFSKKLHSQAGDTLAQTSNVTPQNSGDFASFDYAEQQLPQIPWEDLMIGGAVLLAAVIFLPALIGNRR